MGKNYDSCSCDDTLGLCKKTRFYDDLKAQFCCPGDIDKEIVETFNDLEDEFCDLIGNVEKIEKLFCKLLKLLAKRGCITPEEAVLLKAIHDDIIALKFITSKTARDLKCLERIIL
ncbi:hypothetical protein [Clostridium vincentii]|uniref:Uncharacterized protein n=1 Tax=Clostridium vincentii TaxID=52704 RepID=A0A2T0B6Y1_9CLOT|nr:hypothetical protein [Clostridium vincentii]PRR79636.1 hypothetical protein CLVI_32870 [Clostridium vincentii]